MAVNAQDIIAAIDANEFLQAGFEVIVSNSKNNDTQTITGIAVDSDGDYDEAFAGGLYVQYDATANAGYAEHNINNINSPYMTLAAEGKVDGMPGDHTGIYACNTHDVNKLSDGGNIIINFPGKTLGLIAPKGERADYLELIVGEMYKFGAVCFEDTTLEAYAEGDALVIENGIWTKASADEIDGGVVYGKVQALRVFNEGAYLGTKGVIVKICRKVGGGSDLPDVTAVDDAKYLVVDNGTWGASSGRIADYTVSNDLQTFINGIILTMGTDLMTDYKWHRGSGSISEFDTPDNYEELMAEIRKYTSATTGSVDGNPIRRFYLDNTNMMGYEFYTILAQLGLAHILIMYDDYGSSIDVIVYARREEVAS